MARAHFIGKLNENLRLVDKATQRYTSGVWDVSEKTAQQLVGGYIFLHKTKAQPSFFGGIVHSFRVVSTDFAHAERIEFEVESRAEAKHKPWSGNSGARDWWGGLITD